MFDFRYNVCIQNHILEWLYIFMNIITGNRLKPITFMSITLVVNLPWVLDMLIAIRVLDN